jgi:hypothetical protein
MHGVESEHVRHQLKPVNGGYKILRLRADTDFDPPVWVDAGYLNGGRKFVTRAQARDYMISGVER